MQPSDITALISEALATSLIKGYCTVEPDGQTIRLRAPAISAEVLEAILRAGYIITEPTAENADPFAVRGVTVTVNDIVKGLEAKGYKVELRKG